MSKLCRDCRHVKPDWATQLMTLGTISRYKFAQCGHESSREVDKSMDLVEGGQHDNVRYSYCTTERSDYRLAKNCGTDGKHWESK